MPVVLSLLEYLELMGKIKDRRLRTELKRYEKNDDPNVDAVTLPTPVWMKVYAHIRKRDPKAPPEGTPPEDEVLR